MGRVDGKVALVTGAARGIGEACAALLAEEGATVWVTDRDRAEGERVARDIRERGGDARWQHLDVTQEEQWAAAVRAVLEAHGRLDVLVNNAGLYAIVPLAESTLECARTIFETNVFGTLLGMRHAAPVMAEHGGGSIVNLSSMDATVGASGFAIYGGSKGAVTTMTRDAAIEYARRGVRVNSVHPGYVRTRMAAHGARHEGVAIDALGEEFPMGCIGEPRDVAYGVLYLASDEARWVTGAQLRIDGGATAGPPDD